MQKPRAKQIRARKTQPSYASLQPRSCKRPSPVNNLVCTIPLLRCKIRDQRYMQVLINRDRIQIVTEILLVGRRFNKLVNLSDRLFLSQESRPEIQARSVSSKAVSICRTCPPLPTWLGKSFTRRTDSTQRHAA